MMKKTFSILVALLILLAFLMGWYLFFQPEENPAMSESPMALDPSVTEAMVYVDDSPCSQKAIEIERAATCDERWDLFRQGLASCRNQVVTTNQSAGAYYEEELLKVVECFDKESEPQKALNVLKEATQWGDWNIDHGPTVCPGESHVQAAIEVRTKSSGACLKADDIDDFLQATLNQKNWKQFFNDALRSPQVVNVGPVESDNICVEPQKGLQTVMERARQGEGEWLAARDPGDEFTYYVGMNPPLDYKLIFKFVLVDECLGLVELHHNLSK